MRVEEVVLVDEHDNELGTMEKMEAHRKGVLHRAFSVLIFNSKGDLLIQQRAKAKYHSAWLWAHGNPPARRSQDAALPCHHPTKKISFHIPATVRLAIPPPRKRPHRFVGSRSQLPNNCNAPGIPMN